MATFYLVNSVRLGATVLPVGKLIDDAEYDVAALRRAGAQLVDSGNAAAASAAARIGYLHLRQGISDADAEVIMLATLAAASAG